MATTDEIQSVYRRALLLARDRGYQLNRDGVERLYRAFAQLLNRLAAEEGTEVLTPERAEHLRQEVDAMLRQLQRELVDLTEGSVGRTLVDLVEIHRRATDELFRQFGRGAVLSMDWGGIPARALATMLSRPNAATFQTLYRRRIQALAPEIDTFLDAAISRGVSAGRGAKDLARLLARDDPQLLRLLDRADVLVDDLHRGAGAIDYAAYGLDEADTKALRELLYDARRIQVSETNNALRAANAQAMDESPVVTAAKWSLSGRHHVPDVCDLLAKRDAYGYGPGMYPPSKWPHAPHSHCGCYQGGPVRFRPPSEWSNPKPAAAALAINPLDDVHYAEYADRWTEKELERNRQLFAAILAEGERTRARRAA